MGTYCFLGAFFTIFFFSCHFHQIPDVQSALILNPSFNTVKISVLDNKSFVYPDSRDTNNFFDAIKVCFYALTNERQKVILKVLFSQNGFFVHLDVSSLFVL